MWNTFSVGIAGGRARSVGLAGETTMQGLNNQKVTRLYPFSLAYTLLLALNTADSLASQTYPQPNEDRYAMTQSVLHPPKVAIAPTESSALEHHNHHRHHVQPHPQTKC